MSRRRWLRAGLLLVLLAALGLVAGAVGDRAAPVAAAGAAVCPVGGDQLAVVVDFGDGRVVTHCVAPGGSGIEVLRRAGFGAATYGFTSVGGDAAVCAISPPTDQGSLKGCSSGPSCLTCQQPDSWQYFPNYRYSQIGGGDTRPGACTVEVWRWGRSQSWGGTRLTTDQVCPAPPATTAPPPVTTAPPPATTAPPSGGGGGGGSGGGGGASQPGGADPGGAAPGGGTSSPSGAGATGDEPGSAPGGTAGDGSTTAPAADPASTTTVAGETTTTEAPATDDEATDDAVVAGESEDRDAASGRGADDERADGVGTSPIAASGTDDGSGGPPTLSYVAAALLVVGIGALALRARRRGPASSSTP